MGVRTSGDEKQVSTISKNYEKRDDPIKISFDSSKITCVTVKKPFSCLFWVLTTLIILLALGGIVFEVHEWLSVSRTLEANNEATFSPKLGQVLSKKSKSLEITKVLTLHEHGFTKILPEKEFTPDTHTLSDGTTEISDRPTITTISDLFTILGQTYKPGREQVGWAMTDSRSTEASQNEYYPCTEGNGGLFDSKVYVSSTGLVQESYLQFLGEYTSIGLFNERLRYKKKGKLILLNFLTNITEKGEPVPNGINNWKWTLNDNDHLVFDSQCGAELSPTDSNCIPKWHFCSNLNGTWNKGKEWSAYANCTIGDPLTIQCKKRQGKEKLLGVQESIPVCLMDRDPGPCRASFIRHYYNKGKNGCEEFNYGGCMGNKNNFETIEQCESTCKKR